MKEKQRSKRFKDLTGFEKEDLKVIEYSHCDEKTRVHYWKVLCKCGNIFTMKTGQITDKKVDRTCKHLSNGSTYNYLTIRRLEGNNIRNNKYICDCKCGKETIQYGSDIINGHVKSCGCIHKESAQQYHKQKAIKNKTTFGDYIVELNRKEYLDKLWSIKNNISPFEIPKCSSEKFFLNCMENEEHGDYEISLNNYINGGRCQKCNPYGKEVFIENSLGAKLPQILTLWSDKNDCSAFEVNRGGNSKKVWIKCKRGIHEDFQRYPHKITDNNWSYCPKCWKEFDKKESMKNSKCYKGGITPLYEHLRSCIRPWIIDSFDYCNRTCVLTDCKNNSNLVIHHIYQFSYIVEESLQELNLEVKPQINLYSEEELKSIEELVLQKHYKYGLGICISKEVHKLFHRIYGYTNTTPKDWEDFEKDFKEGKYNID